MDNRTMHRLGLDDEGRKKLEAFVNAAPEPTLGDASVVAPPRVKKGRSRRGWSKWWRKQLEKHEASRG